MLGCDFLTVETVTLKTPYVLEWIELGTRTVHLGGVTPSRPGSPSSPGTWPWLSRGRDGPRGS